MNLINRMMSYDKAKIENQEQCNCEECVSAENADLKNQIAEYPKLSEEEIEQIISERYSDKDKKTKKFIRKALKVHGDRYDYSNVVYVKNNINVEIICRIEGHKPFPQMPSNHLKGRGCKLCGIKKRADNQRMTLEEFIERSRIIHNNKYDYSKVNYTNATTEVIIICPKHEDFKQTPSSHLCGNGCKKCANEKLAEIKTLILEEFIERANAVHGIGTYDYSKVKYIDSRTEVIITCPKHGDFPQTPDSHWHGRGCKKCANEKLSISSKLTLEEFIKRANEIHDNIYDYSKVVYVGYDAEVIITCPKHGDFKQTPNHHLRGCGCSKCKNNYKGEIAIENYLTRNNIKFEAQKRFKDCKDSNTLPFDFYLPYYNLCIEFDGEGHFKPIKRSKEMTDEQAEEKLNYVQRHDEIKTNYCKNNGINLLRICYDENVEEKLTDYFQNL